MATRSWLRRSGEVAGGGKSSGEKSEGVEVVYRVVEYKKERKEGSECPVCLSVYVEGEEVRQLKICNHIFHVECIDTWLSSHSTCPVCRASVGGSKRNKRPVVVGGGDDDFRQGLPDSASLV